MRAFSVVLALMLSSSCAGDRASSGDTYTDVIQRAQRSHEARGALAACVGNWSGRHAEARRKVTRFFEEKAVGRTRFALVELGETLSPGYAFAVVVDGCVMRGILEGRPTCEPLPEHLLHAIDRAVEERFLSDESSMAVLSDGRCVFVTVGAGPSVNRFAVYAPFEIENPSTIRERELIETFVPLLRPAP